MAKVNWGIKKSSINNFDRDAQFKPYMGKLPPNGVYKFRVRNAQAAGPTRDKNPQLRVTFVLVPRDKEEKKYAGFSIMKFMIISDQTNFHYVPFFDAVGITDVDFIERTFTDEQGNIKKIGKWKNDGKSVVLAEIRTNTGEKAEQYPKDVGWIQAFEESDEDEDEDEYDEDDEDGEYDDDEDEDEEVEEKPKKGKAKKAKAKAKKAKRKSRDDDEDEDDDF